MPPKVKPESSMFPALGGFFTDHKTELKEKLISLQVQIKKIRVLLSSYKKSPPVLTPAEKKKKQELKEQRKMMKDDGVTFATFREKKEKRVKAVKKELTADEKKAAAKEKKDALEKKIASFTPTELLAYQKKINNSKELAKKSATKRKEKAEEIRNGGKMVGTTFYPRYIG